MHCLGLDACFATPELARCDRTLCPEGYAKSHAGESLDWLVNTEYVS